MAWFTLARVFLVAAMVYAAILLRPISDSLILNGAFGLGLAFLIVLFEVRLRHASPTGMLGALLGGMLGLALAKALSAALFWADTGDKRVAFLHSALLVALPYLGLLVGARHGQWLEPARLVRL